MKVAKSLLTNGADANTRNNYGDSPLLLACEQGSKELVSLLLEYGAKTQIKDSSENTPLHKAAKNGFKEIIDMLARKGAEIGRAHV